MKEEGCGADVVSSGELYTALSAGFDAADLILHGNNKTPEDLVYAVSAGVGRIVVDNLTELENLSAIAVSQKKTVPVMLRIKPGIDAHTHAYVRTGQIDSKFGFALETGEALQAILRAISSEGIELRGLHCHIGSQIFDVEPFELAAEVMIGLMARVKEETGVTLGELNLGGGFGIKYTADNDPAPRRSYMQTCTRPARSSVLRFRISSSSRGAPSSALPGLRCTPPAASRKFRVSARMFPSTAA
jgi:diaminopimelate decarboxylase